MICTFGKQETEIPGQIKIQEVHQATKKYMTSIFPCQNSKLQSCFCTKMLQATKAGFLGLYTVTDQSIYSRRSIM